MTGEVSSELTFGTRTQSKHSFSGAQGAWPLEAGASQLTPCSEDPWGVGLAQGVSLKVGLGSPRESPHSSLTALPQYQSSFCRDKHLADKLPCHLPSYQGSASLHREGGGGSPRSLPSVPSFSVFLCLRASLALFLSSVTCCARASLLGLSWESFCLDWCFSVWPLPQSPQAEWWLSLSSWRPPSLRLLVNGE